MKYFKFYPSDFLVGTSFMTNEEVGIYIRMLIYQWDKGSIPANNLEKLFNCTPSDIILSKFKIIDGFLINDRLEVERVAADKKLKNLKASGKKGSQQRWKEKDLGESIKVENDMPYKFKINNEPIYVYPSEYLREFCGSYIDNLVMKSELPLDFKLKLLGDVLNALDSEYSYYDFNSVNHLRNAFKVLFKKQTDKPAKKETKLPINGSSVFD